MDYSKCVRGAHNGQSSAIGIPLRSEARRPQLSIRRIGSTYVFKTKKVKLRTAALTHARATRGTIDPGGIMSNLNGLASIVSELRGERTNLVTQLKHIDAALAVLGKLNAGSSVSQPRRIVSASARRKMSLAQKARWAKASSTPKRTMSAAARRKIAAAQRARWAKMREQKRAA